jgi:polysaccharide export outer membrane protein
VHNIGAVKKNYKIQVNDRLEVQLFANGGEVILDPNNELEINNRRGQQNQSKRINYLVRPDSTVVIPVVGLVNAVGLTVPQLNDTLSELFSKFYVNPFVLTQVVNRRVFVLGPEKGMVIPLENENSTLIEILTIYGGLNNESKSYNIRIIRGDLQEPAVQIVDLSTIEGMKKANLSIQPNDIIYIEPGRRVVSLVIRDITPFISLTTSLITLSFLIISNANRNR